MAEELPIPPGFTREPPTKLPPIPPGFTTEPPDPELAGWQKTPAEEGSLGIYKKAGAALLPSAGRAVSGLWDAIKNYDQIYAHIKDVGISGLAEEVKDDVVKHYGSLDRVQKTFETDPFRVIMDIATLASGGGAAVRTVARTASELAAPISRVTTGIPGAWGEMRDIAKMGAQGVPRSQAITGPYAAATPPSMAGGGFGQQAFHGGVRTALTEGAAQAAHLAGVPPWATRAAGAVAQSPRAMSEMQYGLGAARRIPATWRTTGAAASLRSREDIQQQAKDLLKDKDKKAQLNDSERKIVRATARGNADSNIMLAARGIIQRRMGMQSGALPMSPMAQVEPAGDNSYGGTSGDVPSRQEGGPVEAGKVYGVGEQGPETYVPSMTGPAASPGLARSPTTGEAPVAQTHGGKTFFQFAWDKMLEGESLSQKALKAFVEPEAYDPSGPFGAALGTVGARLPFARAGELGAGGGKMVQPGIKAYHGSPHEFERFSSEHIGTGEGAQAYGHGLYFAENPKVAAEYRDQLSGGKMMKGASVKLDPDRGYIARKPSGEEKIFSFEKEAKEWVEDPGKMYEVNITAEREHFLDWDKPISEQSEFVKEALSKLGLLERDAPLAGGKAFREVLQDIPTVVRVKLQNAIKESGGDIPAALKSLEAAFEKASPEAKSALQEASAKLEKLGISFGKEPQPGRGADILELVKKEAYNRALAATSKARADELWGMVKDPTKAPASFAFEGPNRETVSKILHEAGIPGIKYLDQGSRIISEVNKFGENWFIKGSSTPYKTKAEAQAAAEAAGQATSNFVVFNDALINIIRKYGIAAIAAIPPAFSQTQKQ
jgi:hypothetical protein